MAPRPPVTTIALPLPAPVPPHGADRPVGTRESDGTDRMGAAEGPAPPPRTVPAEERALVVAAQAGSDQAFAALVRLHSRRAYAVARSIVLSHDDAEDAVQEGFLHAFRALDRFRPDQAFGAWLHRIVANAALDLARRRKVREADDLPESLASPHRDPAEADELRRRLESALAGLGARQRAVIVLHDVEGYKHAEIGALLGIPEGTARSDLHHARAHLRRLLANLRTTR